MENSVTCDFEDKSEIKENHERMRGWNLLEYPIPAALLVRPSQKASHGNISGTKRGIIDPLVSKPLEQNSKYKKKWLKIVKMVKMV